jgi:Tol biopolymer transport system component
MKRARVTAIAFSTFASTAGLVRLTAASSSASTPPVPQLALPVYDYSTATSATTVTTDVIGQDGSGLKQITLHDSTGKSVCDYCNALSFSPDGTKLVFLNDTGEGPSPLGGTLWIADADGSNAAPVPVAAAGVQDGGVGQTAWSADSKTIYFTAITGSPSVQQICRAP